MEDGRPVQIQRFLIVVRHAIVREDLSELLLAADQGCQVVASATIDEVWDGRFTAAFFDTSIADLMGDPRIRELQNNRTAVVVLDGALRAPGDTNGFEILAQPFRSDDVLGLLRRVGIAV